MMSLVGGSEVWLGERSRRPRSDPCEPMSLNSCLVRSSIFIELPLENMSHASSISRPPSDSFPYRELEASPPCLFPGRVGAKRVPVPGVETNCSRLLEKPQPQKEKGSVFPQLQQSRDHSALQTILANTSKKGTFRRCCYVLSTSGRSDSNWLSYSGSRGLGYHGVHRNLYF